MDGGRDYIIETNRGQTFVIGFMDDYSIWPTGTEFSRQVVNIAQHKEFHLLRGEKDIYIVRGEHGDDFDSQLTRVKKAQLMPLFYISYHYLCSKLFG